MLIINNMFVGGVGGEEEGGGGSYEWSLNYKYWNVAELRGDTNFAKTVPSKLQTQKFLKFMHQSLFFLAWLQTVAFSPINSQLISDTITCFSFFSKPQPNHK